MGISALPAAGHPDAETEAATCRVFRAENHGPEQSSALQVSVAILFPLWT